MNLRGQAKLIVTALALALLFDGSLVWAHGEFGHGRWLSKRDLLTELQLTGDQEVAKAPFS